MSMIPYGRQDINEADIQAVVDVLRSDFITQGPVVPAFESAVSNYCGVRHAIAVNSATSALHIACLALGVNTGDIVWTTPITFVASANCALYCGAEVDFVDIDPKTYNMSVEQLAIKLALAKTQGRLPKVVIPVHLSGQSCEMETIHLMSKQYGFKIIEDASHAIGGKYKGEPVGNCKFSDITVFSFHPVKIITTGEGGMALTNSDELARKMQLLRSHGITRDPSEMTHMQDGPWYYQQITLGYNYRMTDIQAALGLSQIQRLDEFVINRHKISEQYDLLLNHLPVTKPWAHPDSYSGLHLYIIRINLEQTLKTHLDIFNTMRNAGICVNLHYIPVYLQPIYKNWGFSSGYCPEAERYYAEAISIPMYPTLTQSDMKQVVSTLKTSLKY
jgi:UDP-4-amino-4,6-dideoxy-N-acetyl-beta-L-altrosamine transaminase